MKKLLTILVVFVSVALYGNAGAYVSDTVHITLADYDLVPKKKATISEKKKNEPPPQAGNVKQNTKKSSPETARLLQETSDAIKNALARDFSCLKIFTPEKIKETLDSLKRLEYLGPQGEQFLKNSQNQDPQSKSYTTTAAEEEAFTDAMKARIDALKNIGDAKYAISVTASVNKIIVNLKIRAVNKKWVKRSGIFYDVNIIYPTVDAALDDTKKIADDLVKAFIDNASDEATEDNEVCPFTGKVEVKATAKRDEHTEDTFTDFCNGADHLGRRSKSVTGDRKELWQLERTGNPDTKGTLEASLIEKISQKEEAGCHQCPSGRKGDWIFTDTTESTASASELDASTWVKNEETEKFESDHKDAIINLRFYKDGTYKVGIRAVSKKGSKYSTHTTTELSVCSNQKDSPPKTGKQPITFPLEQLFGPFNGTVRNTQLKDKKTFKVTSDDNGEVTEYTVEFDLKRPGVK